MSIKDICNLPIRNITDKNAVLFLWATAPKLEQALEVMKSWGFTYKTNLVWDKEIIGLGFWFRGQHELLLIGVKGSFTPPISSNRISSVYREKRTFHSKKPDFIRDYISKNYPDKVKIELFARERRDLFGSNLVGWDVWGNEVESDIQLAP